MLNTDDTLILIIDIQEKLVNMLEDKSITAKAAKLLKAARILDVPVIITEQYPKGLGATVEELKQETTDKTVFFEKTAMSALQEPGFKELLQEYNRKNILVCGIEAHVCVYQTISDLINIGYKTEVMQDIIASRKGFEFSIGLEKMRQLGASITCLEIILFELLKTAKHPNFKDVQGLIK